MYYHLTVPLAMGAVALAFLAVTLGHSAYLAFVGLILSATSQASNPLEWGYPATYLHGPALTSGWAVANCISAYGGKNTAPWEYQSITLTYELNLLVTSCILWQSISFQLLPACCIFTCNALELFSSACD